MIKIGCAAYSYREYLKDGRMSYEDFIEEAYKIGLDGVEMTLYWLPSRESGYFKKLKRIALSRGLPISCAGISTNFCNPDPLERERIIKAVEEGAIIARELGAPALRIFGGYVPEGYSEEQALMWTIEGLKRCVKYAEENGVVIALENHGGITARADSVIRIVESVGSPWLRVNLDLGNYRESTYEDIAKTVPYAVHIHGKVSISENMKVDYERVKRILEDNGYNGFISIEYEEKEDPKIGVCKFAKYLLKIF
ncbi:MAG: sugar phosphate isomerase/epimerase family protein [Thermoproteota archaeon]|nr:sugar phosphate isomerase/epimerase [Candidatus Brockarchaeota archaeon]